MASSIQKTRKNGYALTKTRSARGISGIAVPIFDRRRYPIASLCAVSTLDRMKGNYLSGLASNLKQEAEIMSAQYELARMNPTQVETWRRAMEVNLTAAFHLSQTFAPLLKTSKGGNIINITSIYGEYGPDWGLYEGTQMGNPVAYAVSKGGLVQLTRWLATTIAPEVRVNAVSPGGIFRNQDQKFVERYEARTPMKRMAIEDDFRGVISFLASDMSSYVTGQNIAVDGGWGIW